MIGCGMSDKTLLDLTVTCPRTYGFYIVGGLSIGKANDLVWRGEGGGRWSCFLPVVGFRDFFPVLSCFFLDVFILDLIRTNLSVTACRADFFFPISLSQPGL